MFLKDLLEDHTADVLKLESELLELGQMLAEASGSVQVLVEREASSEQLDILLADASAKFEASRRGLGLVNKLTGVTKSKHLSRVMSNMNRLRATLQRIMSMLAADATDEPAAVM